MVAYGDPSSHSTTWRIDYRRGITRADGAPPTTGPSPIHRGDLGLDRSGHEQIDCLAIFIAGRTALQVKKTTLIGMMAAGAATASLIAVAPHAAAQPAGCPNENQTTAFVDYSWTSNNIGVWVACVPYVDVNHQCFAPADLAKPKLYRRGDGPDPECRSIYNSGGNS
jgi:hypothetical protein